MKSLRNRTAMPLRIHLPAGKVLHLGPGKAGRISDDAVEHPNVAKLLRDGALVLEDGGDGGAGGADDGRSRPQAEEHGRGPVKVVHTSGDR